MNKSNYYIRFKGRKIYLFEDNVRTICPNCGKEHTVDLLECATGEGFTLQDTVFCEACSGEAQKRMQNMSGRYIPVADLGMKA